MSVAQEDKGQGCIFVKHGKKYDVYKNMRTGAEDRVPRHNEINEIPADNIIKNGEGRGYTHSQIISGAITANRRRGLGAIE